MPQQVDVAGRNESVTATYAKSSRVYEELAS